LSGCGPVMATRTTRDGLIRPLFFASGTLRSDARLLNHIHRQETVPFRRTGVLAATRGGVVRGSVWRTPRPDPNEGAGPGHPARCPDDVVPLGDVYLSTETHAATPAARAQAPVCRPWSAARLTGSGWVGTAWPRCLPWSGVQGRAACGGGDRALSWWSWLLLAVAGGRGARRVVLARPGPRYALVGWPAVAVAAAVLSGWSVVALRGPGRSARAPWAGRCRFGVADPSASVWRRFPAWPSLHGAGRPSGIAGSVARLVLAAASTERRPGRRAQRGATAATRAHCLGRRPGAIRAESPAVAASTRRVYDVCRLVRLGVVTTSNTSNRHHGRSVRIGHQNRAERWHPPNAAGLS